MLEAVKPIPSIDLSNQCSAVYSGRTVAQFHPNGITICTAKVLGEEPLSIRVQGNPYAVMMRTPGDEIPLAIGFCLSEGIIDSYGEVKQIAYCDGTDTNVVTVTLDSCRLATAGPILDRRGFVSQTSCGICGKEVVEDLMQIVRPINDRSRVNGKDILACRVQFFNHQCLYQMTRASHAAAAFDADFRLQGVGEDVGRHNAVDKILGKLLIDGSLADTRCMMLSSRVSYELVQKVARAKIPIVLALSRPTTLAVSLAEKLNITLICSPDEQTLLVYSGAQRIKAT